MPHVLETYNSGKINTKANHPGFSGTVLIASTVYSQTVCRDYLTHTIFLPGWWLSTLCLIAKALCGSHLPITYLPQVTITCEVCYNYTLVLRKLGTQETHRSVRAGKYFPLGTRQGNQPGYHHQCCEDSDLHLQTLMLFCPTLCI